MEYKMRVKLTYEYICIYIQYIFRKKTTNKQKNLFKIIYASYNTVTP